MSSIRWVLFRGRVNHGDLFYILQYSSLQWLDFTSLLHSYFCQILFPMMYTCWSYCLDAALFRQARDASDRLQVLYDLRTALAQC